MCAIETVGDTPSRSGARALIAGASRDGMLPFTARFGRRGKRVDGRGALREEKGG
jgi:hypothetical protein